MGQRGDPLGQDEADGMASVGRDGSAGTSAPNNLGLCRFELGMESCREPVLTPAKRESYVQIHWLPSAFYTSCNFHHAEDLK